MLKKWIDEIRSNGDLYKPECWKYHLSGNVMEISILPVYLKNKKYRCSVIAVGQVLQALSKKIEEQHLNFHIQSFPSLENPEIVAAIRIHQKEDFTSHFGLTNKDLDGQQTITEILNNLVKQHKFYLRNAEDFSHIKLQTDISFKNYQSWLIITSAHNNPFTWLNMGYFKESLRNQSSHLPAGYLDIFDLCSGSETQYANLHIAENEYLQFLIGIQPENISVV